MLFINLRELRSRWFDSEITPLRLLRLFLLPWILAEVLSFIHEMNTFSCPAWGCPAVSPYTAAGWIVLIVGEGIGMLRCLFAVL